MYKNIGCRGNLQGIGSDLLFKIKSYDAFLNFDRSLKYVDVSYYRYKKTFIILWKPERNDYNQEKKSLKSFICTTLRADRVNSYWFVDCTLCIDF